MDCIKPQGFQSCLKKRKPRPFLSTFSLKCTAKKKQLKWHQMRSSTVLRNFMEKSWMVWFLRLKSLSPRTDSTLTMYPIRDLVYRFEMFVSTSPQILLPKKSIISMNSYRKQYLRVSSTCLTKTTSLHYIKHQISSNRKQYLRVSSTCLTKTTSLHSIKQQNPQRK